MRFQAGIQILLIILAIVIVITVIKPKFTEIQFNQNEIVGYKEALAKAGQYNQLLAELLNQANNIPASSIEALEQYLPTSHDPVEVARDIENIIASNGLLLVEVEDSDLGAVTIINEGDSSISRNASGSNNNYGNSNSTLGIAAPSGLVARQFEVNAIGNYDQIKAALKDFEKNSYPLRLIRLEFQSETLSSLNKYQIVLETYALKK